MSLISNTTNVVGSTSVVSLYNVDKYNSKISFDLTKDSQLIYFLNFVSELLKYQDCDSYNIFVNLLKKQLHKLIPWRTVIRRQVELTKLNMIYVELILKDSSPC